MSTTPEHVAVTDVPLSPVIAEVVKNRADPYTLYRHYRETDPMNRADPGIWTFTRYHDILTVLRDDRFSVDPRNVTAFDEVRASSGEEDSFIQNAAGRVLLFTDPPDHTRLRTLVNKAFTPRTVERLRAHITELVGGILDDVAGGGEMDVIEDLAYPLPALVICELMGVPTSDRDMFRGWSGEVAPVLDPWTSKEVLDNAVGTLAKFLFYFMDLVQKRRDDPQDDLVSALLAAEEQDDKLTDEQLLALCILVFIAGHETTQNLIGNGLLALLRHPDQLRKLRENPSLTKDAVEELLRYDSPVQLTGRSPTTDIEIADVTIPKGDQIILLLGAGNRDPAVFEDPDRLDITRAKTSVLSFGAGAHFCLGAGLARLEGAIVFNELLARFPGLELAIDEPEYRETLTLRGLKSLPVRL
ncbi:MAG TPA: cytochrome P450 [Actinomycetota bacterium]|jgi:cytochrome P450|nr:cytochrome P450 [Actinomycetota bacterium]